MELVGPSDPGYDRLRAVFDSRVERRPAVVARCFSAGDVGLALVLAASRGHGFAVRGGGMSAAATLSVSQNSDVPRGETFETFESANARQLFSPARP